MNLAQITPLLLTCNEADNLERTLSALHWAQQILVLDSGSTDATLDIAARHPTVRVLHRAFDDFAGQRNFGLNAITTPWALSLDADHWISPKLVEEIKRLEPGSTAAYLAPFDYHVWGRRLRCAILPARPILFAVARCRYEPDGHAERLVIDGASGRLSNPAAHDDRKPLSRWVGAQDRYARQELAKLRGAQKLGLADRVRRWPRLAPLVVFVYVLVLKGGILDGRRGWFYAYQRLLAELNLALHQMDADGQEQLAIQSDE